MGLERDIFDCHIALYVPTHEKYSKDGVRGYELRQCYYAMVFQIQLQIHYFCLLWQHEDARPLFSHETNDSRRAQIRAPVSPTSQKYLRKDTLV